jgi:hypothetical protein
MTPRGRWLRRVFLFVWGIPAFVVLPLSLIGLGLPAVMWFFRVGL